VRGDEQAARFWDLLHLADDLLVQRFQLGDVSLCVGLVELGVGGVKLAERLGDVAHHLDHVAHVLPGMRIELTVLVLPLFLVTMLPFLCLFAFLFVPVFVRVFFLAMLERPRRDPLRHDHAPRRRAGGLIQPIEPGLEHQAVLEDHLCVGQLRRIRGAGFVFVGVGISVNEGDQLDLVAGHVLHQVGQDAEGGHGVELGDGERLWREGGLWRNRGLSRLCGRDSGRGSFGGRSRCRRRFRCAAAGREQ
jgi:hypothetical protein